MNILYLVKNELMDLPILYLSRYIVNSKQEYYALLQSVRDKDNWSNWVSYIIQGIEITAREIIDFVNQFRELIVSTKRRMQAELPKIYSQDLLDNLFFHPYTKVQFLIDQLGVTRITATKYLAELTEKNFVTKHRLGRTNYYVNNELVRLIVKQEALPEQ